MEPRTAPAWEKPCEGYGVHTPEPLETEKHHVLPMGEQRRLWGAVLYEDQLGAVAWMCGLCHANVHIALRLWLAGKALPRLTRKQMAITRAGYELIQRARAGWRPLSSTSRWSTRVGRRSTGRSPT